MFSSCPFSLLYVCTSTTSLPQETSQQKALKVLFWSFGCFLMLLTACSPLAKQTPYSLDVPVEVRSPPRAAAVPRCGVSTLHRVLFLNAPVPGNSVCLHARPPVCFCLFVIFLLLLFGLPVPPYVVSLDSALFQPATFPLLAPLLGTLPGCGWLP